MKAPSQLDAETIGRIVMALVAGSFVVEGDDVRVIGAGKAMRAVGSFGNKPALHPVSPSPQKTADPSAMLTTDEVAARLRASLPTLARWRGEGEGPAYVKRRGRVLYREEDLIAYESSHGRTKTRDAER
ncbi:helix-turn-helix domain-containing protein [Rhizobium tumorigenes]